jgi:hypothetical protein
MLQLAGEQVESLLDELLLPLEVRQLPAVLGRCWDRLLADPRLLAPIEQAWERTAPVSVAGQRSPWPASCG